MDALRIEGGRCLEGRVRVSGSRKAAPALLAATLLADGEVELDAVAQCEVVEAQLRALQSLGARVERNGATVVLRSAEAISPDAGEQIEDRTGSSLLLVGPMLARAGAAVLPYPGPTETGPRPLELHLKGLAALGATTHVDSGRLIVKASRLLGADIFLDYPSLDATLTLMLTAVGALGRTVLRHAAKDPEVVDVANMLGRMGARIRGAGTDVIIVDGASTLSGTSHKIGPDRYEAALYLAAALATAGQVSVCGIEPAHLLAIISKSVEMGAEVMTSDSSVTLTGPKRLHPATIRALPYPGFPSDVYPLLAAACAKAAGPSIVTDSVSPDNLLCLGELRRLGVKAMIEPGLAVFHGGCRLSASTVRAQGPSAAGALLLTLLACEGEGTLEGAGHLQRHVPSVLNGLTHLGMRARLGHVEVRL